MKLECVRISFLGSSIAMHSYPLLICFLIVPYPFYYVSKTRFLNSGKIARSHFLSARILEKKKSVVKASYLDNDCPFNVWSAKILEQCGFNILQLKSLF